VVEFFENVYHRDTEHTEDAERNKKRREKEALEREGEPWAEGA
jgi:hypothetical protein